MNQGNVIEVKNVKKKFKVFYDKGTSLKEKMLFRKRNHYEERWVLKGISINIKKGEAIGLIGKNGCGKSTTLKLISRIMYPTEGTIEVKGRVSSLLELGAGFHPDMSGRENIYTNASIFGLTRKEINERIDDIIAFSELEEFIDNPVRTYSSGMYMRLAFSVAINVDADILLIDEILAVGDVSFQAKCFERLKNIKASGTTIVIVSHSMGQIEQICDRCIWIENGLIKEEGIPKFVDDHYLTLMEEKRLDRIEEEKNAKKEKQSEETAVKVNEIENKAAEKKSPELPVFCGPQAVRRGNKIIEFTNVFIKNSSNHLTDIFKTGETIIIEMTYISHQPQTPTNFTIGITRDDGVYCYGSSVLLDSNHIVTANESGIARIMLENNTLLPGKYYLDIGAQNADYSPYDTICSVSEFRITLPVINEFGILSLKHTWEVDGTKIEKAVP